jgi:hypothetical protein
MATGQNMQTSPAQEAGRPQPQTTIEPSGGPFIRHSQPGYAPIYNVTGSAMGGILTQPLVARPGYFRNFRVTHSLTTGGTLTSAAIVPDAPYNVNSLIQLKDAFGTPLIVAPGYEASNLIPTFSGGHAILGGFNQSGNLPSNCTLSATTGAGQFSYALPLEFAKAYGVLSAANASLLPTLQFNFNSLTSVFGASTTGTPPTIGTALDTSFYWLPEGVAVEPPGLGTTRQWILQQANPQVPASAAARIQFPRLGGYLDTLVVELRNNAGASVRDGGYFPGGVAAAVAASTSRLQLYVDGVPMVDATMAEWYDNMAIEFQLTPTQLGFQSTVAGTYPTVVTPTFANQNLGGVLALTRKSSLNQVNLGLLDTGEAYLSTNPGTLLELNFAPAGAGSGGTAATASVLVGQIVPTGAVIQGLPEV